MGKMYLLKELSKFQYELISLINQGYKTSDIEQILSIKRKKLIGEYHRLLVRGKNFLTKEEYEIICNEYLMSFIFKEFLEEPIVIISDTHIGSKYENLEYLKQVRNFIKDNDIKYLLHGGDIGDGMVEYSKEYSTYQKQINHILDTYDLGLNTKQYILGGNHDAKYKQKNHNYDILDLLEKNNSNIEGLGYYQAYFKLGSAIISFEHNSYYKSFGGRDLSILGHGHCLKYKDTAIFLPTLSDNFPNAQKEKIPGFIVLTSKIENDSTRLKFKDYKTTENGIEKGTEKVYTIK